jgi:choline kinase
MTDPRCALILAAGASRRLLPLTRDCPKCLLPVGGQTILSRQLDMLASFGIDDVVIVTGYRAAAVRARCGGKARLVHNPRYASTNSLYSLVLAEAAVAGRSLLLLNSDVVVDPSLVERLLEAPAANALLVDLDARLDEEAMKVVVRDGLVAAIDKGIDPAIADGENVGVVKFDQDGAAALFRCGRAILAQRRLDAWAPAAYAAMLAERAIGAIPTDGLPWIEIDFPEDLARAEREVVGRLGGTPLPAVSDERPYAGRTGAAVARRRARSR